MSYLFLSCARTDRARMAHFKAQLQLDSGRDVWMDRGDPTVNENDREAVRHAIQGSSGVIVAVTEAWPQDEAITAFHLPETLRKVLGQSDAVPRLFIVLFDAVSLPTSLDAALRVNAIGAAETTVIQELVNLLPEPEANMPSFEAERPALAAFLAGDDRLKRLRDRLYATTTTYLRGPAGVGKTQFAADYADRYRFHYSAGVYWINAAESWTDQFVEIAKRAGLFIRDQASDDTAQQVWVNAFRSHILRQTGPALIVLDHVVHPADVHNHRIAQTLTLSDLRAHILVTLEGEHDTDDLSAMIDVIPLSIEQARTLLRRTVTDGDDVALDPLIEILERLPLALNLAASVLRQLSLPDLLQMLSSESDSTAPLERLLRWQWNALDEPARTLLTLLAAYPEAADIPSARLHLLGVMTQHTVAPAGTFDRAASELNAAGLLVRIGSKRLALHPLVWSFVRDVQPGWDAYLMNYADHLVEAYRNPASLFEAALERGYSPLLYDLRKTRIALTAAARSVGTLTRLERLFEWETPFLPDALPGDPQGAISLVQHIRERAHHQGDDDLRIPYDRWLAQHVHLRTEQGWRFPLDPAPRRVFHSSPEAILSVAVLPDNRKAVTGTDVSALRVWDIETGEVLCVLEGHTGPVYGIAALRDGRRVLSASDDYTLRLWDIQAGELLNVLRGHTGPVRDVALLPDGKRIVSASWDGTLRVWDLETGGTLHTLIGHGGSVNSVAVMSDGIHAISASFDRTLCIWNLDTGQSEMVLEGHQGLVLSAVPLPDGKHALSASSDRTLRLWNLETSQTERIYQGHTGPISAVTLLPDSQQALSASADRTVRLWDITRGEQLRVLSGHKGPVNRVIALPDGRRALSASEDGTLRLWDIQTHSTERSVHTQDWAIRRIAVLPDRTRMIAAAFDGTLKLWSAEHPAPLARLPGQHGPVLAVTVLPDGQRLLMAISDGTLLLAELDTGRTLSVLQGHTTGVLSIAITPDGSQAISGSYDGTLRVWDLLNGEPIVVLGSHSAPICDVLLLPETQQVLSKSSDGELRLWNFEAGHHLRTFKDRLPGVCGLARLSDMHHVITGSDNGTLKIVDIQQGSVVGTLTGHTQPVKAVVVLPGGHHAASIAYDRTLRLWDLTSRRALAVLHITEDPACLAGLAGDRLAIGDNAGGLRVIKAVIP